jgi:hypothetical protein
MGRRLRESRVTFSPSDPSGGFGGLHPLMTSRRNCHSGSPDKRRIGRRVPQVAIYFCLLTVRSWARRPWPSAHVAVNRPIDRRRIAADHRAAAQSVVRSRWRSIRIRRGRSCQAMTYSAANTPRSGSHPVSGRCTAASRRVCRPAVVPRFRDIHPRTRDFARPFHRRSLSQGSGQCVVLACRGSLLHSQLARRFRTARLS